MSPRFLLKYKLEYVMDCYFRQFWYDRRLVFNFPGLDEFSLSWLFLDRVWKPDTFFLNGKKSHLHRITVPNKFLRLRKDGFLMYSMRLTIKASCPMHLRKFPLDSQSCPLLIGSYGYRSDDIVYEWDRERPVVVEENVELSQYRLVNYTTDHVPKFIRGVDVYSVLKTEFHLRRNIGYFVLQLYVPCGLIVSCSWVSFWIDPAAVPARVQLGVTTVLTMTTMGFGGRAQMPRVSYATALDSFVIICFSFVFAVMIEYAVINFFDKIAGDMKKLLQDRGVKKKTLPDTADLNSEQPRSASMLNMSSPSSHIYSEIAEAESPADQDAHLKASDGTEHRKSLSLLAAPLIDSLKRNIERRKSEMSLHLPSLPIVSQRRKSEASLTKPPIPVITVTGNEGDTEDPVEEECVREEIQGGRHIAESDVVHISCDDVYEEDFDENRNENEDKESGCLGYVNIVLNFLGKCIMKPWKSWKNANIMPREEEISRMIITGETPDKFSKIDIESRKYFPIAFCILMTSYWFAYMYYITDEFPVAKEQVF
ncbi:gamma-aminobutyric acid receptor subunit alpha-1-like isoform X2 [Zootermopsis nevadensis]|uniref:gamma-aminobutyric acid receptor subunit alpha-1-like isoform X2 n=1 Tax=Zootermopsis nevadensis TaxID=136037 RepID=UPI000B8E26E4|nr:gamma-aminobutyric acid receptor subunit alpha-1-like isoform X2 [Zootermopsis nevadensis]